VVEVVSKLKERADRVIFFKEELENELPLVFSNPAAFRNTKDADCLARAALVMHQELEKLSCCQICSRCPGCTSHDALKEVERIMDKE
jgi:hypothetical protein